jgi:hypothetical protein
VNFEGMVVFNIGRRPVLICVVWSFIFNTLHIFPRGFMKKICKIFR